MKSHLSTRYAEKKEIVQIHKTINQRLLKNRALIKEKQNNRINQHPNNQKGASTNQQTQTKQKKQLQHMLKPPQRQRFNLIKHIFHLVLQFIQNLTYPFHKYFLSLLIFSIHLLSIMFTSSFLLNLQFHVLPLCCLIERYQEIEPRMICH